MRVRARGRVRVRVGDRAEETAHLSVDASVEARREAGVEEHHVGREGTCLAEDEPPLQTLVWPDGLEAVSK